MDSWCSPGSAFFAGGGRPEGVIRSCFLDMLIHRMLFFFFSSRRRHTRYWRDWSSDVCSSDLGTAPNRYEVDVTPDSTDFDNFKHNFAEQLPGSTIEVTGKGETIVLTGTAKDNAQIKQAGRSEERRVGKECRSGASAYQSNRNR